MEAIEENKLNPDQVSDSEPQINQELFRFLNFRIRSKDEETEEEEEEEEEFSFMCGEANSSPIAAEDVFINGQIKPFYPLFNRDLLLSGVEDFPFSPPVDKVFVESTERNMTSPAPESDEIVGPHCAWRSGKAVEVGSPEMCKKSNSTGFSKIWRFKEYMGRSNSDGRDAFVFLNNDNDTVVRKDPPAEKKNHTAEKKDHTAEIKMKKSSKNKAAVKTKTKTTSVSAHEAYLKSKAKDEGPRRRTYLPYRPELMGFFTNAKGGLTKNVHPF